MVLSAPLRTLLDDNGCTLDDVAASDFLNGLAAAPLAFDPAPAIRLLAPAADAAAVASLQAEIKRRAGAEPTSDSDLSRQRLADLRRAMAAAELDGFLVPMADEYQNEYVPQRAMRIAWLSGFTGSAGLIIVLKDNAALFTDGRYTLQAPQQVDTSAYECRHISEQPPSAWLQQHFPSGGRFGFDPWLLTVDGAARYKKLIEAAGGTWVSVKENLIDQIWQDQPAEPLSAIVAHGQDYAGVSSHDKRQQLAEAFGADGSDALVVTASDSIAWLLNVRGGDVARTPLALSFAVLHGDGQLDWYVDTRKLTPDLATHLGNEIAIHPHAAFLDGLTALGQAAKKVQIDPALSAAVVAETLAAAGAQVIRKEDPCQLAKAIKNEAERAGARSAHIRDGAAVCRFLAWLDGHAAGGEIDEMAAAEKLAAYRRDDPMLRDLSFDTISGSGPNGAIVHYRVTEASNRKLQPGELYLVDSGAQYLDGTTDITRTIAIGAPSEEMRNRFTRVLQGHIALATARFPKGTHGGQLDAFARAPLWQAGLDFDHGTGHGVGSYLGVHEGPQRISKAAAGSAALQPGMIVSNEPGYYKTDAYGIRIENLVLVSEVAQPAGAERQIFGFETLTRAPIDRRLIDTDLLTAAERAWVDDYHARVFQDVADLVDAETRQWLQAATQKLE